MPTYPELGTEPWYSDEYEPPALARFNAKLRAFYGHSKAQTGSKGDNRHLKGRHRSINWVLNSRFCTNRSYGTADMRDRRGPWDALRATDIGLTGATLRAASARLDAAVRAGRLLGLAEWFGTTDGTHVVGWYEGHTSSSDSSHLYHLHLGYWTEHTDDAELFDLLFETITGTPTGDDDMATVNEIWDKPVGLGTLTWGPTSPPLPDAAGNVSIPAETGMKAGTALGYAQRYASLAAREAAAALEEIKDVRAELETQGTKLDAILAHLVAGAGGGASDVQVRDALGDALEAGAAAVRAAQ